MSGNYICRLGRWTLNAVTVLSLVLCVATLVLWIEARSGTAYVGWRGATREALVSVSDGHVSVGVSRSLAPGFTFDAEGPRGWLHWKSDGYLGFDADALTFYAAGFGFDRSPAVQDQRVAAVTLMVPCWAVGGGSAVLPALWLWRWRRGRNRQRPGRCPICSYDLTGNVSGVCPECGTTILRGTAT